jgi:hypothetical protein
MYRNLFAVFATLALGVTAASASTATNEGKSLEQRVMAAQKSIGAAMNGVQEAAPKADSLKTAQYYWRNYQFRNYFPNYFRNYYGG